MSTIYKKLFDLQQNFKSAKDKRNNFMGFNYRNYETMLTSLKPMLAEKQLIIISKEELLDNDYMKCTMSLIDIENEEKVETSSVVKIDTELKTMSKGQLSGSIISYLKKYTLQSLLLIDDGNDLDTLDTDQTKNKKKETTEDKIASILDQINECSTREELKALWEKLGNWTKNQTVKTAFTARKEVLK